MIKLRKVLRNFLATRQIGRGTVATKTLIVSVPANEARRRGGIPLPKSCPNCGISEPAYPEGWSIVWRCNKLTMECKNCGVITVYQIKEDENKK